MRQAKLLVVGNWKMNPATLTEARRLFKSVVRRVSRVRSATVVVCPPTLYLGDLVSGYGGTSVSFGAQDVSVEKKTGSFTGEVSASMLKRLGVDYVIVGHSERRARGETDELVAQKVKAACTAGLVPILCVGEQERDADAQYLKALEQQVHQSLSGVSRQKAKKLIVAYEPIWAIGKSAKDAATPEVVHSMVLFIKKVLVKKYGRKLGQSMKIIYGGSVEPGNADSLMQEGNVDGFLPGHASLVAEDFADIVRSV